MRPKEVAWFKMDFDANSPFDFKKMRDQIPNWLRKRVDPLTMYARIEVMWIVRHFTYPCSKDWTNLLNNGPEAVLAE